MILLHVWIWIYLNSRLPNKIVVLNLLLRLLLLRLLLQGLLLLRLLLELLWLKLLLLKLCFHLRVDGLLWELLRNLLVLQLWLLLLRLLVDIIRVGVNASIWVSYLICRHINIYWLIRFNSNHSVVLYKLFWQFLQYILC